MRAALALGAVFAFGAYCIGLPVQAASVAVPMMKQLKKRPRYTARKPRTTEAAVPE